MPAIEEWRADAPITEDAKAHVAAVERRENWKRKVMYENAAEMAARVAMCAMRRPSLA